MYDLLSFDEVNKLSETKKYIPYNKYFGEMPLTKKQKEDRISLAEDLEKVFTYAVILMLTMEQHGSFNIKVAEVAIAESYFNYLAKHMDVDNDYFQWYVPHISREIARATKDNMDDPYYFSRDRAKFIAENEANATHDYNDYAQALKNGAKTKTWITMKDNAVRNTHRKVDEVQIGIDDLFLVGNSFMRFPHDALLAGPEELVNCRCVVKYS